MEELRFPVGRWTRPNSIEKQDIDAAIEEIAAFPSQLAQLSAQMNAEVLSQTYRPGSWTARQIIHHCADSHVNAYVRFKLALTQDKPTINPYDQAAWAKLADYDMDIELPQMILTAVHAKWVKVMQNMKVADWQRCYIHPEYNGTYSMAEVAASYAWHGRHHLGHLKLIVEKV